MILRLLFSTPAYFKFTEPFIITSRRAGACSRRAVYSTVSLLLPVNSEHITAGGSKPPPYVIIWYRFNKLKLIIDTLCLLCYITFNL